MSEQQWINDIRLIVPACAVWAQTVAVLTWGLSALGISMGCALILLLAGYLADARSARPSVGKHRTVFCMTVLCACAASACCLGGRYLLVTHHPPQEMSERGAEERTVTELYGVLIERPAYSGTRPGESTARGRITLATAQGEAVVLFRSTLPEDLTAGSTVRLLARLRTPPHTTMDRGEWTLLFIRDYHPPHGIWRLTHWMNRRWMRSVRIVQDWQLLTPDQSVLLRGMTMGDTSFLSSTDRAQYRAAGLSHLTAVSGANVACVILLVHAVWGRRQSAASALSRGLALVLFAVIVGPDPSVLRASVSGAITIVALRAGRLSVALSSLGMGMLLLLLLHPTFALHPGFILSVTATLAMIVAAPPLSDWMQEASLPRVWADVCAVTLVCHLSTVPVTMMLFGTASTMGVLTNLAVAPVVPLITILGLCAMILACCSPSAAAALCTLVVPALRWVQWVGKHAGVHWWSVIDLEQHLPGESLPWGEMPRSAFILLWCAACTATAWILRSLWAVFSQRAQDNRLTQWRGWGRILGGLVGVGLLVFLGGDVIQTRKVAETPRVLGMRRPPQKDCSQGKLLAEMTMQGQISLYSPQVKSLPPGLTPYQLDEYTTLLTQRENPVLLVTTASLPATQGSYGQKHAPSGPRRGNAVLQRLPLSLQEPRTSIPVVLLLPGWQISQATAPAFSQASQQASSRVSFPTSPQNGGLCLNGEWLRMEE